jgi:hypothetical protein
VLALCSRPHVKDVDFDTARFVVCTASGLKVNGQNLVMGDELPKGVLDFHALQRIYDTPLRLIETVEYAREIPGLVKACERQNTSLETATYEETQVETEVIQNTETREMCDQCGHLFEDLTKHSKKECKKLQKEDKKGN